MSRNGDPPTVRQAEVWSLIGRALTDKEIARAMGLSAKTVRIHADTLFAKINARNRVEAALLFHGIRP